jgi:hypothetical protein
MLLVSLGGALVVYLLNRSVGDPNLYGVRSLRVDAAEEVFWDACQTVIQRQRGTLVHPSGVEGIARVVFAGRELTINAEPSSSGCRVQILSQGDLHGYVDFESSLREELERRGVRIE